MNGKNEMRLLGLDPGLRHTGWGVINTKDDKISWIASGNVSPKNSLSLSERLKEIHNQLNEIIKSAIILGAKIELNDLGHTSLKDLIYSISELATQNIIEKSIRSFLPRKLLNIDSRSHKDTQLQDQFNKD